MPGTREGREDTMTAHPTLRIIRHEHDVLSAVLRSIALLLSESRRRGMKLDYRVLRAMLFYIDEFPERVHHPKESDLLFPMLRQRGAVAAKVLDRLDRDHAASQQAVRDLEHQVVALEMMEDAADFDIRRTRFEAATEAYVTAYLDHIRLEEEEVLPKTERLLTDTDWVELDAAFAQNRDPLAYSDGEDEFRPLFKRILMTLPAPLGVGPAMETPH
jgi:hemerythrin-like domain-containing protein